MIYAILGILIGIIVGLSVHFTIPLEYIKYTAVVIIGILDAIFGAIRAEVSKDQYNSIIFITGLFFNIILAIGVTYLGERLGLDFYLAATVVFTFRIFTNVGITRRIIIQNYLEKRSRHKAIKEKTIWQK